jgi:hypothetical protein
VAGSPFGSFASTGKGKEYLGFVGIGDLSFYSICRENSLEEIML